MTAPVAFAIMMAVTSAAGLAATYAYDRRYGLGAAMAASVLSATWFQIPFLGVPLNATVATAAVWLCIYCVHSGREILRRLGAIDYVVAMLVAWQIGVEIYHGESLVPQFITAYGMWMLPFAAGRFTFLNPSTSPRIACWFALAAGIIAIGAIVESIYSTNLWEAILTEVDDKVTRVKGRRFGLHRAMGPTRNPIFLGIVLMMLSVMPVLVATAAETTKRMRLIMVLIWLTIILAIVSTVSRGPILLMSIPAAMYLAHVNRVARRILLAGLVVATVALVCFPEKVFSIVESSGHQRTPGEIIRLDDRESAEIYTGTRQRFIVLRVYGPILFRGGLMGYGRTDASGFPPRNLPDMPSDPATLHRVRNVDNAYLNVGLASGWIGLILFVVLLLSTVAISIRMAPAAGTFLYPIDGSALVYIAGVIIAIIIEIFTVHLSYDHGFWWLFLIGGVSGWQSYRSRVVRNDPFVNFAE